MIELSRIFEERKFEVETYLAFLQSIEQRVWASHADSETAILPITPQQQKILYASVFLQLYNLVEATIISCIAAVEKAATEQGRWKVGDLSNTLRYEWVRNKARTHHAELNTENRYQAAKGLCDHLIESHSITEFQIDMGGGGNWDDEAISKMCERLGFSLQIGSDIQTEIKRHFKDGKGALKLIKDLRNCLAHGNISFTECAGEMTASNLCELKNITVNYLSVVVQHFEKSLLEFEYLQPEQRSHAQQNSSH